MRRILQAILALALLGSLAFVTAAQDRVKVGEVEAGLGQIESGFILVPEGTDGPEIKLPVTIIKGTKPGPTVALTAGVHGYEYVPILTLQRLKKDLDPSDLTGTVIMVHVVNIPSYFKRTIYTNPHDWKNQNRVFPGKIDGSMTERIAYQVTHEVLDQCDYHLDLHCGDGNEDLMTYLYYTETGDPELDRQTRELAINFGFKVIIHVTADRRDFASMCAHASLFQGKPSLTTECGRLGRTDEEDIQSNLTGCFNTLKHLGMMAGSVERRFEPVWVKTTTYIRSEHDGIFYPLGHSGRHVQKGELLGYLTDFFGNVIQEAIAPNDGIIMYIITTPPMSKGEPMVKIGGFK
ncbi:MAG: succinylglutamate desuccinylase/aspartoacylase family protein [Candidatus Aminicenantaceae bacterium]